MSVLFPYDPAAGLLLPGGPQTKNPRYFAVPERLVGYWPFDADSFAGSTSPLDLSGENNIGVLVGTVPISVAGRFGNALSFGGATWMTFTTVSKFVLASATSELSASLWINTTSTDAVLFSFRNGSNGLWDTFIGNNVLGNAGTGKPSMLVRDDSGAGLTGVAATVAVNDGKWHHIVWTRRADKVLSIYVDGVLSGTGTDTMTGAMTPTVASSAFGKDLLNGSLAIFNGAAHDLRGYYNRCLDIWGVNLLYQAGFAGRRDAGIWLPQECDLPMISGSAAANLIAQSLAELIVVSNVVATQQQFLATQSLSELTVLGAGLVTQQHVLAASSAALLEALGVPDMTQLHRLTVASGIIMLTLPEVGLTQVQALTVASLVELLALGGVSATGVHAILAAGLIEDLALGSPTLRQLHVLQPDGLVELVTFGNVDMLPPVPSPVVPRRRLYVTGISAGILPSGRDRSIVPGL